ncbi:ATP-binding cassette domain-containing protein [Abyssisolibacter fermentans]|uniref:ATP-binding cassette domain-containing protein n=1 Tax=Abyssisolibacter fermentans TaxID=1766203 RepID=UPI000832DBF3|nr:ATP-binding cassette domain-containing protein [Abyssisolibacter fermentans]
MNIDIRNLSKKYIKSKSKSLVSINTIIPKGIFGLLGENGAGKTTLLKTIATVMPVQEGQIMIDGYDIMENIEDLRKKIGYLPQNFPFFEKLTVYEMLDYIALLKNVKDETRHKEIKDLIEQFNLKDKTYSKINELSGGMKQRLAIAQSFIGNSELIILDEPTVGLDPNERLRFRNIINEKSESSTIIISTHIVSDIAMLCNSIGIMKKGRMIYCGSIEELLKSVEGKIYIDTLHIKANIDKTKYKKIISILRKKNTVEVRFILDEFIDNKYEPVTPTLEDAYFYMTFFDEGDELC